MLITYICPVKWGNLGAVGNPAKRHSCTYNLKAYAVSGVWGPNSWCQSMMSGFGDTESAAAVSIAWIAHSASHCYGTDIGTIGVFDVQLK